MRVGIGYDIHKLTKGRKLIIGGVEIPYSKGLLGHSDADVLLHAVCDALLGAASCGDIGDYFPDTDPAYKGIDSRKILSRVMSIIRKKSFIVENVDTIIIAEQPKIKLFKDRIKKSIASIIGISPDKVGVKAKTNEALGEIGRCKAMACLASVLLSKEKKR